MSLELLYNCEKQKIARREDAILCCLHSCLVSNGIKCIGRGEEIERPEKAHASDMLPAGWGDGGDIYVLSYHQEGTADVFLLKALIVDESMFIQLLRRRDDKVTDMDISSTEFTTANLSAFETAYQGVEEMKGRFQKELIAPFLPAAATPSSNRSTGAGVSGTQDPLRSDPLRDDRAQTGRDSMGLRTDPRLPCYGSSDLDPLSAGMGGGMLFDPLRTGMPRGGRYPPAGGLGGFGPGGAMIPRGSVPPGARFDPFGPPELSPRGGARYPGRAGPDPDHMAPPGFDDQFM